MGQLPTSVSKRYEQLFTTKTLAVNQEQPANLNHDAVQEEEQTAERWRRVASGRVTKRTAKPTPEPLERYYPRNFFEKIGGDFDEAKKAEVLAVSRRLFPKMFAKVRDRAGRLSRKTQAPSGHLIKELGVGRPRTNEIVHARAWCKMFSKQHGCLHGRSPLREVTSSDTIDAPNKRNDSMRRRRKPCRVCCIDLSDLQRMQRVKHVTKCMQMATLGTVIRPQPFEHHVKCRTRCRTNIAHVKGPASLKHINDCWMDLKYDLCLCKKRRMNPIERRNRDNTEARRNGRSADHLLFLKMIGRN